MGLLDFTRFSEPFESIFKEQVLVEVENILGVEAFSLYAVFNRMGDHTMLMLREILIVATEVTDTNSCIWTSIEVLLYVRR